MTLPKQPPEPDRGHAAQTENPTGETPQGVPQGAADHEATGHPTSDRAKTETAANQ